VLHAIIKDGWEKFFMSFDASLLKPDLIHSEFSDCWCVHVYPNSITRVLTVLRDTSSLQFRQLIDITAVDYPQRAERFDVVYHLLSHATNQRIRIKFSISEKTPIPSIVSVFPNACWYEREVYDLFGIDFTHHPDLRRILTDYNFEGHPLRKDFPVFGEVQVRYDETQGSVIQEPVHLKQEYRSFDFLSPWTGTQIEKLPGDEKVDQA
jgi:NADH-quinone oxidoreductase subunit C